jgi:hypothetical protein
MQEGVSIWSSVIVARMPETCTCQSKREITTTIKYNRIEDMKTRISGRQVKIEGKSAELIVNVETLFILEDERGSLFPFSRRDVIKERIPLDQFLPRPDDVQEFSYIAEITDFFGDTFMQGQKLTVIYYLTYRLLAIREQMVTLQPGTMEEASPARLTESDQAYNDTLLMENLTLRRQLKINEMNLLSMKKSLQKAEAINAELSRQIKLLQAESAEEKEITKRTGRSDQSESSKVVPIQSLQARRQKMGRRIKEFFMNNA